MVTLIRNAILPPKFSYNSIIASENGHKDIVTFLLKNGIDVNQPDKEDATALMWASRQGHKEIVQILLEDNNIKIN